MERVFLAGTTTGTTWREELTERLVARGVEPGQIINPQLPPGVRYTVEHMAIEHRAKADPQTIVLIVVCPAKVDDTKLDSVSAANARDWLGPMTMYEVGKFANAYPDRTAVVLEWDAFTDGGRPRKILKGLSAELAGDFGMDCPPVFSTLQAAEDWIASRLTAK